VTLKVVCFDCDGVLADTISSWVLIHEHFGTGDTDMLSRFIAGEISDVEFMADDIRQWKSVQPQIHRDDLLRCYSGVKLMSGAQQVVEALRERDVASVIVSAGVDLMIGSIAKLLGVDDWAANGFQYDDDGYLLDEGMVTVPAHDKGALIHKLVRIRQLQPSEVTSVGDSSMDLSMHIPGSQFIGFNPRRPDAHDAFTDAGVPVVDSDDLRDIWPHLFPGESFIAVGDE
jgi:HAD superfamily PSPase-like hydrolase